MNNQFDKSWRSDVTVLFPVLNEARTLNECIQMAKDAMNESQIEWNIIVADNGSTDASSEIAKSAGCRVINVSEKGYGSALRAGVLASDREYVVMLDADQTYDLASLPIILRQLDSGADIVIGNRFLGGIENGAMPILNRWIGNPFLSWLARRLYDIQIGDFHCGLRAVRTSSFRTLGLSSTGMEFASEMIVIGAMKGQNIVEVPCTLRQCPVSRTPHLRRFRDGSRHIALLLSVAPSRIFQIFSRALVLSSLLLSGLVLLGVSGVKSLGLLDAGALKIASLLLIIGIQFGYLGSINRHFQDTIFANILPPPRRIPKSTSLASATFAILFGLLIATWRFIEWQQADFGRLNSREHLMYLTVATGAIFGGALSLTNEFLLRILTFVREYR